MRSLNSNRGPACALAAVCAAVVLCCVLPVSAQSGIYTPKPGSPERKAIMNALRVPVERDLKRPVIFVVDRPGTYFRVKQGWAFVAADFRHPNGTPMSPSYFASGMVSDSASGLLHRTHGQWHVVVHTAASSDIPWVNWVRDYHAPPGLVPNQASNP